MTTISISNANTLPTADPFRTIRAEYPSTPAPGVGPRSRFGADSIAAAILSPIRRTYARLGAEANLLLASSLAPGAGTIVLGSPSMPFESLPNRRSLLSRLDDAPGRAVLLRCRSAEVLEDLDQLQHLDQDHAVRIEWFLDPSAPRELAQALESTSRLAGAGLDVHWVLEPRAEGGSFQYGSAPSLRSGHSDLEAFFAEASRAGVSDIRLGDLPDSKGIDHRAWARNIEILRLEHGFPVARPGRG